MGSCVNGEFEVIFETRTVEIGTQTESSGWTLCEASTSVVPLVFPPVASVKSGKGITLSALVIFVALASFVVGLGS